MEKTNELPIHNVTMSFHIFDKKVIVRAKLPVYSPKYDDAVSTLSFLHENTKNLFSSFNHVKVEKDVLAEFKRNVVFNLTCYHAVSKITYEKSEEIINFAKFNGMVIIETIYR